MTEAIRNRIKGHRRIRAGDLVPHEWNFRLHPEVQRAALAALYRDVGFARSLLAYELPDGRLKLLDGHLRRELEPDLEVEVEILDVTEEEARVLLLSLDPLAALAETQQELQTRLRELAPPVAPEIQAAWLQAAEQTLSGEPDPAALPEQFLVVVTCTDEEQQRELIERLQGEGLQVRALAS